MKYEHIQRQLNIITQSIRDVEYLVDAEILGEDIRHLESDVKSAQRELVSLDPIDIVELYDIKYIHDEIKRIETGLRILQNNLDRCKKAIEESKDAIANIADAIQDDPNDQDL